jgi:cell fate regulator YaaT (PSP1 superfamily)
VSTHETVRACQHLVRVTLDPDQPGQICSAADGVELESGSAYVVSTEEGLRLGRLAGYELPVLRQPASRVVGTLLRRADSGDVQRAEELAALEHDVAVYCRQRAKELDLPIRPVVVHAPLDRDTVYVCYSAEERVDIRTLARDMTRRFQRRVELRQVGVRDQAKLCGGFGPCGRTLCCTSHMSKFNSITIRMAKAQRLSLNPSRISGMCGRLMCCLSHEAPAGKPSGRGRRNG